MEVQNLKKPGRQCTSKAKSTGKRCRNAPIPGGTVCEIHGGGAPQVQAKARQRLLAACDPAAAELVEMAKNKKLPDAVRLKAVLAILDRAGLGPGQTVEVTSIEQGGTIRLEAALVMLQELREKGQG